VTVRALVVILPGLLACGPAVAPPASAPASGPAPAPAPPPPPPRAPEKAVWPAVDPFPAGATGPALEYCFPPTAVAALAAMPREAPVDRYRRAHTLWSATASLRRPEDFRDLSLAALLARAVALEVKEPKFDHVGGWAALIYYDALNRLARRLGAGKPCRAVMERDVGPIMTARCPRSSSDGEECRPLRRVYCVLTGADPKDCQ
jgi:hypothetical protein